MATENLEKEVISNIRGCLVSVQGQCDLRQICRDYRLLMGTEIPFSKLGYRSLEQFICSIPSLSTNRVNGVLFVDAKVKESSAHISTFVNMQKTRIRKPRFQRPARYSLASVGSKWQPKNVKKSYQNSPRPSAVKHKQFVNLTSPPSKPSTLSARLANRLGPKVVPLVKATSLPSDTKQGDLDDVFTRNKSWLEERMKSVNGNDSTRSKTWLEDRMKSIDINESNETTPKKLVSNGTDNKSLKYFPSDKDLALSPPSAPDASVVESSWSNILSSTQVDSAFITPPKEKASVERSSFVPTGDHLSDLLSFVALHNLDEPQIKNIVRKYKPHKRTFYDCHIKVGVLSVSSYPGDFYSKADAQQEAARLALEELMPIFNRKKSLLISNENDVLERIPPIVQSHYYGIWKEQLEADYTETFSEKLPGNWLEIVDILPNISVTPCLDKFVLRYCKPGEKGIASSMQFVSNISVPTNSASFDENGTLMAEITCPVSSYEIWCREINTTSAMDFATMSSQLEQYCSDLKNLEVVDSIHDGGYYIAFSEMELVFCRVRVFEVLDDTVTCFCIDYGDEITVKRNQLYALPRQFARVQAQAFVCRLLGVEFYEASKSSEYFRSLLGKIVYVELREKVSGDDLTHNVVLLDVEDETVINEQLAIALESVMYTPPELTEVPTEVYLTHIEDSGLVYVQIPYFGSRELDIKLGGLEDDLQNDRINISRMPVTPENSENKLYFVKNERENRWYRTKILEWDPYHHHFAQIQYVDCGVTTIINVDKTTMYLLEALDETVIKFKEQAQAARFSAKNIPPNFSNILRKLIPANQLVLAKLDGNNSDNLPSLKFFKRSEPDNLLFSINEAVCSHEVRDSYVSGKSTSAKLQKLISLNQSDDIKAPSSGLLPCPLLPKEGEFFDVKIPCAVNPYNFFVQPHASRRSLSNLMSELQEKYRNIQYSPLSIQDVIPGKIYASKYDDGDWYRTSVIKVIHPGSISVFYCDYGYYGNLTLQQLLPLDEPFLILPYQAIKAKLAGIRPKHSKWSVDDCKFFEGIVYQKFFVSILVGMEKDVYYRSDIVLNLKLVDTSTANDIYIDQVLINEGIAVAQDTDLNNAVNQNK